MISAIGLGNSFIYAIGLCMGIGFPGAIDTLVSQAFGKEDFHMCGVYLNRGRVLMFTIFLPVAMLFGLSNYILLAMGIQADIAQIASNYIIL